MSKMLMSIVMSFSLLISVFSFGMDADLSSDNSSLIFHEKDILFTIFSLLSFEDKISLKRVSTYLRMLLRERMERKEFETTLTAGDVDSHRELIDRLYRLGECPLKFYSLTLIPRSEAEVGLLIDELFKDGPRFLFHKLDIKAGALSHRSSYCPISPVLDLVFSSEYQIKDLKITSHEELKIEPFASLESLEIDGKEVSSFGLSILATSTFLTTLKIQIEQNAQVIALPMNLEVLNISGTALDNDFFTCVGDLKALKSLTIHSFCCGKIAKADISGFIKTIIDKDLESIKITGLLIVDDTVEDFLATRKLGNIAFRKYFNAGPRVEFSMDKESNSI